MFNNKYNEICARFVHSHIQNFAEKMMKETLNEWK